MSRGSHGLQVGVYAQPKSCTSNCFSVLTDMTIPADVNQKLQEASDAIIGDVIGLCQAMDLLRKDLDQVSRLIDSRAYEAAAQLGYEGIASNFVFLQRCLGGLQSSCLDRDFLVSELAKQRGTSFDEERVAAYEVMPAMQRKL